MSNAKEIKHILDKPREPLVREQPATHSLNEFAGNLARRAGFPGRKRFTKRR